MLGDSNASSEFRPIIMDCGTETIKFGFGNEGSDKISIPTSAPGSNFESPIQNSYIKDWDGMTELWRSIIEDYLEVDPKEHPIILPQPPKTRDTQNAKKLSASFFF